MSGSGELCPHLMESFRPAHQYIDFGLVALPCAEDSNRKHLTREGAKDRSCC